MATASSGGSSNGCCALLRRTNPDRAADLCGAIARKVGPLLPAHRIGRANLRAAFPDRDKAWIEATLRGAWDNLGRVAGEYVHLAAAVGLRPGASEQRPHAHRRTSNCSWTC